MQSWILLSLSSGFEHNLKVLKPLIASIKYRNVFLIGMEHGNIMVTRCPGRWIKQNVKKDPAFSWLQNFLIGLARWLLQWITYIYKYKYLILIIISHIKKPSIVGTIFSKNYDKAETGRFLELTYYAKCDPRQWKMLSWNKWDGGQYLRTDARIVLLHLYDMYIHVPITYEHSYTKSL